MYVFIFDTVTLAIDSPLLLGPCSTVHLYMLPRVMGCEQLILLREKS